MKKNLFLIIFFIFAALACEKVEYDPFIPDSNPGDGVIVINVSGLDGETASAYTSPAGETVFMVETNRMFVFTYTATVEVDYQIWEFYNEEISYDESPIYFYGDYDVKSLKLTVVDVDGESYSITVYLDLYSRYPNFPFYITDIEENDDDSFTITTAAYKNSWHGVSGNYYLVGTVTDIPWDGYQQIDPADTNYRMSADGNIYPADGIGHWIKATLNIIPGDHAFGITRFVDDDPIWGNFKGSNFVLEETPGLIEFHLTNNGEIIPVIPLPGDFGDSGPASVVRLERNEENIVVYLNLTGSYQPDSWWSYLDHNENWVENTLYPVDDFPNWGKFHVTDLSHFPIRMKFGRVSGQSSNNMAQSIFYVPYYDYLLIHMHGMY